VRSRSARYCLTAPGRPGQRAGSAVDVLLVQFGFEQVHGLEEGFLLAGGELVQDAGQRFGGAIEPVADQGCLAGMIWTIVRRRSAG
jgi:hypothetical protein